MQPHNVQLRILTSTRSDLAKLETRERDLYLLAGHVLNEVGSLTKIFGWCLQNAGKRSSQVDRVACGMQALIYAKLLAGKLWEAWEALGKTYFASKPSTRIVDHLPAASKDALTDLKAYFGRKNLINTVRNSFAFHYTPGSFERHWESTSLSDDLGMVFGGTIGNNFNLTAESIANAALLTSIGEETIEAGLQKLLDEIFDTSHKMNLFLEGVSVSAMFIMHGPIFGAKARLEEIQVHQRYEDVSIPYFVYPASSADA